MLRPTPILPSINKDFVDDVVRLAKRYTKSDLSWVYNQSYSHHIAVYNNASANVGNRNIGEFSEKYEEIKTKYERKQKLFS
jgi:hypothetical protein